MGKFIDMTGWKMWEHGVPNSRITVLYKNTEIYHPVEWWCQCSCGQIFSARGTSIRNGETKSCGCLSKDHAREIGKKNKIDLTGQTFNYLTVLYDTGKRYKRQTIWHCLCQCGNEIDVPEYHLKNGDTASCGCLQSSLGEKRIKTILNDNKIEYKYNTAYFKDLFGECNALLRYDFILFQNNQPYRIIEFDGKQHFESVSYFGGDTNFQNRQKRDKIKNQYALSHNIPLVRIPYWERDNLTLEMLLGDQYLVKEE